VHGQQEDAHEFMRYLLESMEKSYLTRYKDLKYVFLYPTVQEIGSVGENPDFISVFQFVVHISFQKVLCLPVFEFL
jgi:uncharacterized UBP type Zn finger protein